jgi:hypothetical protein
MVVRKGNRTRDLEFLKDQRKVLARGIEFIKFVSLVTDYGQEHLPNDLVQSKIHFLQALGRVGQAFMADPKPGDMEIGEAVDRLELALRALVFFFTEWADTKPSVFSDIDLNEIANLACDLLVDAINKIREYERKGDG